MTKVLHVYPQLECGGTEMVIYNLIKHGNPHEFSYDVLVQRTGSNDNKFRELGCNIHTIPLETSRQYYSALLEFFSKHRFEVVHAHMNAQLPTVLKAAADIGIKCRIAHSHSARTDIPQWLWPLFYFRHHPFERYATTLFGCSNRALKWLFPTQYRNGNIIFNGIELDRFTFNPLLRAELRSRENISINTKVYINVGRCTTQKNQKYILEIATNRQHLDELYLIVGDGPLFNNLSKEVEDRKLKNVRLLGQRTDVADLLSASDFFLLPSIYEGLGIVAIEAQAAGLRVIANDAVPTEANMELGNYESISIKRQDLWHKSLSQSAYTDEERNAISMKSFNSKYNIKEVGREVVNIYRANL